MPLTIAPCRQLCDWVRTPGSYDGKPLLACRGCGSQWVRSEPWTPAQADGSRPAAVVEELRRSSGNPQHLGAVDSRKSVRRGPAGGADSEGS